MSRYCLDTSAYSYFMRGHGRVAELIERAEWIGLPAIVLGELRVGFQLGQKRTQNEKELGRFLAHPLVKVVPVDEDVSHQFADIVIALRDAGAPRPTNDIWIAASAARTGAVVLTFDRHFEAITRVGSLILEA